MPDAPVLVINTGDNSPVYMHSIDASEAVKIGDYRYATKEELERDWPERVTAMNRMRNVNVNPPPELQTAEQKAAIRQQAAEEAAALASGQAVEPLGVRQALGAQPTPPPTAAPAPAEARTSRRGSE